MKFKKNKNVNTIEYFAQCICAMASCSCLACGCKCYGTHAFQDPHQDIYDSKHYSKYAGSAYLEELGYR